MRKLPNKYRNQLGPTATSYMVLVGVIVAITGSAFVYMKNQHLVQEDRKRELEEEVARFNNESEYLKQKIEIHLNRQRIVMGLIDSKSNLINFPPRAVTTIATVPLPGELNKSDESNESSGQQVVDGRLN